jgi:glycosyltransferase involved in cell wall biosynthesis
VGDLVPAGDEAALRGALEQLAADPTSAADRGRQGRARALDRYSAERMVRDYDQLYREVLEK